MLQNNNLTHGTEPVDTKGEQLKKSIIPNFLQPAFAFFSRTITHLRAANGWMSGKMPKRLYTRSLLIIILPFVLLQAVVAFVFMERHWQTVTQRLSISVARDIGAIINLAEARPTKQNLDLIETIASQNMDLNVAFLPLEPLPPPGPKPFFSMLDNILVQELTKQVSVPFWIDTVGNSDLFEIRALLDQSVLRVFAKRSQAYASSTNIFLIWMIGTSLVLLTISIFFLRNQIRPIQQLAEAAESFGKGRAMPQNFQPSGAEEVRRAGFAFIQMRERIERQIEQRTAMLAGVSHDLRTILTRFKLQLALLPAKVNTEELEGDVTDMHTMLEGYIAFARGEGEEETGDLNLATLFEKLHHEATLRHCKLDYQITGKPIVHVRANAFTRLVNNLVTNSFRYANTVSLTMVNSKGWLTLLVDDNGPGIPAESREYVFKPFVRLDKARNLDASGTGLGLAIARDVARSHGGTITLDDSPLGGLRATVRIPA